MSGWKPPAIPDVNEKTILDSLRAMKEIIEMQEHMRGTSDGIGFLKVWDMNDCPAGVNCIDRFNNVLIRNALTVLDGET